VATMPEAEVKAEPEAEVKLEPEAEVKAEPEAEVKAEPEAEVKAEPQIEVEPEPQAEETPESQAEEKEAVAAGDGGDDGLYRGMLEMDITSVDAKQIPNFLSQLQQVPNLQVVSFKGLPGGNSLIALAINHPMPLPDILRRMPTVESVAAKENEVHVVLKVLEI